jgi:hypothetical protein
MLYHHSVVLASIVNVCCEQMWGAHIYSSVRLYPGLKKDGT